MKLSSAIAAPFASAASARTAVIPIHALRMSPLPCFKPCANVEGKLLRLCQTALAQAPVKRTALACGTVQKPYGRDRRFDHQLNSNSRLQPTGARVGIR